MERFNSFIALLGPLLVGVFGAGGAGTWYFSRRSRAPLDYAEAKKVEAEASMVVVEGWQRLAETLQRECASLRERVEILEKKSRDQDEERHKERMEYERKINALEIELNSVISSSKYKDKQLEEQQGFITRLQERVSYLENELKKYNADTI